MSDSSLTVQNLDHLGIVAGLVDELGLVEYLNERIGVDPRETVSIGVVVNLTDERRHILQFFGAPCRKYYLLC